VNGFEGLQLILDISNGLASMLKFLCVCGILVALESMNLNFEFKFPALELVDYFRIRFASDADTTISMNELSKH
jgi:hypothetical protein